LLIMSSKAFRGGRRAAHRGGFSGRPNRGNSSGVRKAVISSMLSWRRGENDDALRFEGARLLDPDVGGDGGLCVGADRVEPEALLG
jgi:hypothetical protein